jgi:hypothetical protein
LSTQSPRCPSPLSQFEVNFADVRGTSYFATGHKVESDEKLAEAIRVNRSDWPSEIARVYAFSGERDAAFEWLDRAYDARDETPYVIKDDPLLKNIEADRRYKAFLRKMNLPER